MKLEQFQEAQGPFLLDCRPIERDGGRFGVRLVVSRRDATDAEDSQIFCFEPSFSPMGTELAAAELALQLGRVWVAEQIKASKLERPKAADTPFPDTQPPDDE